MSFRSSRRYSDPDCTECVVSVNHNGDVHADVFGSGFVRTRYVRDDGNDAVYRADGRNVYISRSDLEWEIAEAKRQHDARSRSDREQAMLRESMETLVTVQVYSVGEDTRRTRWAFEVAEEPREGYTSHHHTGVPYADSYMAHRQTWLIPGAYQTDETVIIPVERHSWITTIPLANIWPVRPAGSRRIA